MSSAHRLLSPFASCQALTFSLLLLGCRSETAPELTRLHLAATPDEAALGASALVRRGYLGHDWWGCARDGAALRLLHPDSAPLRAWTILCVARSGGDALAQADAMLSERPGDPWALFARAGALIDHPERGAEGVLAAREALAAMPGHPDAVWQLGRGLVLHGSHAEIAAFFAEQPQPALADVLALELAHASSARDSSEQRVFDLAARTRAADPRCVDAEFLPAQWLLQRRRPAEAAPFLARALELSPHAPALHAELWHALQQTPGLTASEQRAAIDADVVLLLQSRGDDPSALEAAANVYRDMSPETHDRLVADLLARFPASPAASSVRHARLTALAYAHDERHKQNAPDLAQDAHLRRALDEFLAGPPPSSRQLADAYRFRYTLVRDDPDATPAALLAAVQEWAPHEQLYLFVLGPAAADLAERTPYAAEAEAIARACIERAETLMTRARTRAKDAADLAHSSAFYLAPAYEALGAVLLAQRRHPEAREALEKAYSLTRDRPDLFVKLAALAEAEGRIGDAEKFLIEGSAVWRGHEVCDRALRALYVRRYGSERGYERHREQLAAGIREQRRQQVLATAIAEPGPLPPFALPKLGGGELRSDALLGRVAVINLWSTSCRPCVAEMPALQQLADAFAGSRDVVVTTINLDDAADHLPAWLRERDLRLEVALGGRYAMDNNYTTLPMTLFVDRSGAVVFTKDAATEQLVEEFTWRIEALRDSRPGG
ncbi:redoxin domain-containing protein [Nannocystis sp. SCPEA4]|uniref:redoxin domain-containing protein n=1 Tax=Nannocystis sp. SCPEA4 TaxID=2996787 RepID=UPI00226F20EE|nr:redoxin domain-containing protein [Nannocystis sp. SCPEA4]MCY1054152.1 redoxin domain-containing protein [Nannocystis sp. SCPEA4]